MSFPPPKDELEALLRNRAVRELLCGLIESCGVGNPAPLDPQAAAYFEGRRRIGLEIMHAMVAAANGRYAGEVLRQIVDIPSENTQDR